MDYTIENIENILSRRGISLDRIKERNICINAPIFLYDQLIANDFKKAKTQLMKEYETNRHGSILIETSKIFSIDTASNSRVKHNYGTEYNENYTFINIYDSFLRTASNYSKDDDVTFLTGEDVFRKTIQDLDQNNLDYVQEFYSESYGPFQGRPQINFFINSIQKRSEDKIEIAGDGTHRSISSMIVNAEKMAYRDVGKIYILNLEKLDYFIKYINLYNLLLKKINSLPKKYKVTTLYGNEVKKTLNKGSIVQTVLNNNDIDDGKYFSPTYYVIETRNILKRRNIVLGIYDEYTLRYLRDENHSIKNLYLNLCNLNKNFKKFIKAE